MLLSYIFTFYSLFVVALLLCVFAVRKNFSLLHLAVLSGVLIGTIVWSLGGILPLFFYDVGIIYTEGRAFYMASMVYVGAIVAISFGFFLLKIFCEGTYSFSILDFFHVCFGGLMLGLVLGKVFFSGVVLSENYVEFVHTDFVYFYSLFVLYFFIYAFFYLLRALEVASDLVFRRQARIIFYIYSVLFFSIVFIDWILPVYFDVVFLNGLGALIFLFQNVLFVLVSAHCRFLSLNLSLIRFLSHLTNTVLLAVPLIWLYEMYSAQVMGGVLVGHLAGFWVVFAIWSYRQTFPWLEMTWNLVFFRKKTNLLNEISASVDGFAQSVDRGFMHLAHTLAVRDMEFVPVGDQSRQEFRPMYEYFQEHPKEELVREELDYRITHFVPNVKDKRQKSTLEILRENMDLNDLTVVIPVFDQEKNLLGVSVVADDDKGRLFSVQEIEATRHVLERSAKFLGVSPAEDFTPQGAGSALSGEEQKSIQENFMRGLLHEIRTPLTMAEGLRDLIDWKKLDKEDQKFLSYSQDSLLKLGQKMERLSQAFSWSRGDAPMHKTFGSVKELCNSLGDSFPDRVVNGGLRFSYPERYEKELFSCDFYHVKEALVELIGNGFFFNDKPEPEVEVRFDFDEEEELLRIEVEDNGMGILQRDRKKIFEVMYTAAYSRNESEAGVGAGLPIARGIALAHGGDLVLENSDSEEGSVFVLSLPLELVYDDGWDD